MNEILLGNILAAIGEGLLLISSVVVSKKKTIGFQTSALFVISVANFVLGGIGGAVLNFIGAFRNLLFFNGKTNKAIRISFAAFMMIATLIVCWISNFSDIWFWLPLAANIMYTLCAHWKDSRFKAMCATNFALWLPYDILIGNYVAVASDIANIVFSIRGAIKNKNRENGDDETSVNESEKPASES